MKTGYCVVVAIALLFLSLPASAGTHPAPAATGQDLSKLTLPDLYLKGNWALVRSELADAGRYYAEIEKRKPGALANHLEYKVYRKKMALAAVVPEYRQRILCLVYKRTRFSGPGLPPGAEKPAETDPAIHEHLEYRTRLLGRVVEAMSRGKLGIDVTFRYLDTTLTALVTNRNHAYTWPDFHSADPFPVETLLRDIPESDVVFSFYPMSYTTYCYGRRGTFPLIPYTLWSTLRGNAMFNMHRNMSMTLFMHEYFHVQEYIMDLPCSDEFLGGNWGRIKELIPDYPMDRKNDWGFGAWEYYEWQFGVNFPKVMQQARRKGDTRGWRMLSYKGNHPDPLTARQRDRYLELLRGVPAERLRQAAELRVKADELWKNGDKDGCDKLMRKILELNPAYHDAFRHFAERLADNGEHGQALAMYDRFFELQTQWWHFLNAGKIALGKLSDPSRAKKYFQAALDAAWGADRSRVFHEWMWATIEAKDYSQAWAMAQDLKPLPGDKHNPGTHFNKAYVAFLLGRDKEMAAVFDVAAGLGILGDGHYARFCALEVWNLYNAKKSADVLRLAPLAMRFKDPRWSNESRFLYGETLWQRGEKQAGEAHMRAAAAALKGDWWTGWLDKVVK